MSEKSIPSSENEANSHESSQIGTSSQRSIPSELLKLISFINPADVEVTANADKLSSTKDSDEKTLLHYASFQKSPDSVNCLEYLLALNSMDINSQDTEGMTPLHISACVNNLEALKLLCSHGADVNLQTKDGETSLHKSALFGHKECILYLLQTNVDLEIQNDKGETALHFACQSGQEDIVAALLLRGALVNAQDSLHATPLHRACASGSIASFHLLLENKADITVDINQWSPMHYASLSGNVKCLEVLLQEGENPNAKTSEGLTPLHIACYSGHHEVVKKLLEIGVPFDTKDEMGQTPVHHSSANGHLKCIQLLHEAGWKDTLEATRTSTPLHLACFGGFTECVSLFIKNGAEVNARDHDNATPLHKAAFGGKTECVHILLENGAETDVRDIELCTPLHKAAWSGSVKCISALIEGCLDKEVLLEAKDNQGSTAIIVCAYRECAVALKTLIKYGANLNSTDHEGLTALHVAASLGFVECTQILVEAQADLNVMCNGGKTPFIYAMQKCQEDIARYLVKVGAHIPSKDFEEDKTPLEVAEYYGFHADILIDIINEREEERKLFGEEMTDEQRRKWDAAIQLFNSKPKKGIQYLVDEKLIGDSPQEIAAVLNHCDDLNKKQVGDYLGEEENVPVLDAFASYMDFTDLEFDVALRRFLMRFRLPGEAQKIDRIMEKFAQQYFNHNPNTGIFENADVIYILAFAVIMLNTDAHSLQIKKKMSKAEFLNNTKTINNGGPLPREFMEELYDKIVNDEIKMETDGKMWTNAEKKGWLTKQVGGQVKSWKRRWFILDNNVLYYFKTPQDSEPCGIIPLENVSCAKQPNAKRKHCMAIFDKTGGTIKSASIRSDGTTVRGNHKNIFIAAASSEEEESWINAINTNVHQSPLLGKLQEQTRLKHSQDKDRRKSISTF